MSDILLNQEEKAFNPEKWLKASFFKTPRPIGHFYRGCLINKKDGKYLVSFKPSLRLVGLLTRHISHFRMADIQELCHKNQTLTDNLFDETHKDLIVLAGALRSNETVLETDFSKDVLDYLSFELSTTKEEILQSIRKYREGLTRPTIFDVKKTSVYFDRTGLTRNEDDIDSSDFKRIQSFYFLESLEVDRDVDFKKLIKNLETLKKGLSRINRYKDIGSILKGKTFHLRIRKIRRTKKDGVFYENYNTIFVDPRNIKSLFHEVSHWVSLNLSEEGRKQLIVLTQKCRPQRPISFIKENYKEKEWEEEILADKVATWLKKG